MLDIDSIEVIHGQDRLLSPLSFKVETGSTLVIMGETGAGKSLIAQSVMGVLPAELQSAGKVFFKGQRIDNLLPKAQQNLWGRSLVMLPQEPWHALDPLMRSFGQVYESHKFVKGLSFAAARRQTRQDFRALNLEHAMHKRPYQLSGGMSQRVAFASAMAGGGKLVIADEPTKGLDSISRDVIIDSLNEVPARGDILIVITHDIHVARQVGGNLLVLKDGDLVESGVTLDVLEKPTHHYTRELIAADPSYWQKLVIPKTGDGLLQGKNLVVGRENTALHSAIDFSLSSGGRLALAGPSGKDKTTFLDTLAGLLKPVSGSVVHDQKLSATDIQKIYQDPPSAFAPHISLKKSLSDVAKLHSVAWLEVELLLKKLGISATLLNRIPAAVSGGELQRIAIARALLVKPKLLFADEPTSRLDPITQQQTMKVLSDATQENQTAVLLVTHDAVMADKWAQKTLTLV